MRGSAGAIGFRQIALGVSGRKTQKILFRTGRSSTRRKATRLVRKDDLIATRRE